MTLGLITGTGYEKVPALRGAAVRTVITPYGQVEITMGTWHDQEVGLVQRHGPGHTIAPSKINYQANIWGLHHIGASAVLAVCVVGTLAPEAKPGDLVLLDQFMDLTKGRRADTFFDGEDNLRHCDMTYAYSQRLRNLALAAAKSEGIDLAPTGTYGCFEGPRFESSAEARMAKLLGADVVGMTGYPEVALARELGLEYCAVAVVSNYAPGVVGNTVSLEEVTQATDAASVKLFRVLDGIVRLIGSAPQGPIN